MECTTTWRKPKKQFNTLEEAIAMCKILNKEPKRIHKLVSYKCSKCCKFHIGSNKTLLKHEINIF